jgi:hypothetical protein
MSGFSLNIALLNWFANHWLVNHWLVNHWLVNHWLVNYPLSPDAVRVFSSQSAKAVC